MKQVEIKVTAATVGSFVVSCIVAILNSVSDDSDVISGLPGWLQFLILLFLPPVLTFLSGYQMPSYTSKVSREFNDTDNV